MRLLTFESATGPEAGVLLGDEMVPVRGLDAPASSARGLLEALDAHGLAELADRASGADRRIALGEASLLAPVPNEREGCRHLRPVRAGACDPR